MTTVSTTSNDKAPPHVLVIPFPAQGHMIPLLDLTHTLASISGFTITVLTTPKNLPLLNPLLSAHPSLHPLILPLPPRADLPTGVENIKDAPSSFRAIILSFSNLHDPLHQWFQSQPHPPHFIISDIFCGWTHRLATELGIRRLVFSPSGAFALSTMYYLWRETPKRKNVNDENEVVCYHTLPNLPKYPWWQLSPLYRSNVEGEPDSERLKEGFLGNIASWGLIVNTFTSLEKNYLDSLRDDLGHDRVWAVGPLHLLPHNISMAAQRGGSSSVAANDVVSWLDQHEDRNVVYVCFGSQSVVSKRQMKVIASALDKSGVHFIWSVKDNDEGKEKEHGVIPLGFEDRTAGRGLVIRGWAPQVVILRHRAVGVFLCHCGWNSVLEAVVAGVRVLAWPMTADQFVNATLLLEELKVARRVYDGVNEMPDSDELGRVFAESVRAGGGVEATQALKLRTAALEAIEEGGSSGMDLTSFMDCLSSSS